MNDYQKQWTSGDNLEFTFYSHLHGYHMGFEVDVRGYDIGEGSHISVFISIEKGDYDADLNWPFLGDITVVLLNQLDDKNHHSVTLKLTTVSDARVDSFYGKVGIARGFPQYIPHSALDYDPVKNTRYLKDDTLYFRVSVESAQ